MSSAIHKQAPQHLFDCPICLQTLVIPITLTCGHTFCEPCIKSNFFNFIKRLCPLCRRYLPHNLNSFSVNVLLDHLLELKFFSTKGYKQRLEIAKTFTKDINDGCHTVVYHRIRNVLPWMIIMLLLYHLLKTKVPSFTLNFKIYKEKALKIANSIRVENNLQLKIFLFSQFLRFLFSLIAIS